MLSYQKQSTDLIQFPSKFQWHSSQEKEHAKFHMEAQEITDIQSILSKINTVGAIIMPNVKSQDRAIALKAAQYWRKN